MDAENLIQTLENDRRLIRNMMPDLWTEFAVRVAKMTPRFENVKSEQEISRLGEQLLEICLEYDFVRQRLSLAEGRGPLVYRLPKPKPPAQRTLDSLANRFVRFGQSIDPKSKSREE